jgi:hypothetical protein
MSRGLVALNLSEGLVPPETARALEAMAAVIAEVRGRTRGAKVKFRIGLSVSTDSMDDDVYRPQELAAIRQIEDLCAERNLPVSLRTGGPSGRSWLLEYGV